MTIPWFSGTVKLEFSPDPLSDTTPTYVDITQDLREITWFSGKRSDRAEPEAGGMVQVSAR